VNASALLLVVAAAAFAISCVATRVLIGVLRQGAVLDLPNARSSHVVPTPRGGGIAVIGTIVLAWLVLWARGDVPLASAVIALAAAALAVVS